MPKLIKSVVENLTERGDYRDDVLKGFLVRVNTYKKDDIDVRTKTFIVNGKVHGAGKTVSITIGRFGVFTCEEARAEARKVLGEFAQGVNRNTLKREQRRSTELEQASRDDEQRLCAITLAKVLEDYIRSRNLKTSTVYNYRCVIRAYLGDWLDKPVMSISRDMVENRHREITENSGKGAANNTMRVLRALFIYAGYEYESSEGKSLIESNPVKRLSQVQAWHKLGRRQTVIKQHELKAWFDAVSALPDDSVRDFLILLLLTGLRKNEGARLKWCDVDLKNGGTILISDTKNGRPHTLPMSNYLREMLKRRWATRVNEYVFPGKRGNHVGDSRYDYDVVMSASGVKFVPHDLRRTFITVAEGLDLSHYAIKRLVNHSDDGVTAGYIVPSVERLREPMQRITDRILSLAGATGEPRVESSLDDSAVAAL